MIRIDAGPLADRCARRAARGIPRGVKRSVVLAALLAACSSPRADAPPKPWRVDGGAIVDASGRQVVLRGVNLAGKHKNAPYTDAFTAQDYVRLHDDLGFTVLRFLVTWAAVQ